jgi:hypothetical protein
MNARSQFKRSITVAMGLARHNAATRSARKGSSARLASSAAMNLS